MDRLIAVILEHSGGVMQVFELALILHVFTVFSEKLLMSDKVVCTYLRTAIPTITSAAACSTIQLHTVTYSSADRCLNFEPESCILYIVNVITL